MKEKPINQLILIDQESILFISVSAKNFSDKCVYLPNFEQMAIKKQLI
jgi:hypothetical protein